MTTPNKGFEELVANQSQPHVPINATFRELDVLVQAIAIDFQTAPPVSPNDGDIYIVDSPASGDWANHEEAIAYRVGGAWLFITPQIGWKAYVRNENSDYRFAAGSPNGWSPINEVQGSTTLAGLDDVSVAGRTDGQILTWDDYLSLWFPDDPPPPGVTTLAGLSDVDATAIANAKVLTYNGVTNKWEPQSVAAGGTFTLGDATDVAYGSPGPHDGDVMIWNASLGKWVPQASGSAAVGAPGIIPDLQFWFESDDIKGSSGFALPGLRDRTPWAGGIRVTPVTATKGAVVASTTLNSLAAVNFPNSSDGRMNLSVPPLLAKATVFAIFKPASLAASQALIAGAASSLELRVETTGTLGLVKTNVAVIGNSSGTLSAGTWYQFNATYDAATGAYAFRLSRAASGSGTNVQTVSVASSVVGYNQAGTSEDLNGMLAALIIYNRVLTLTEIQSVEAYLLAKWGV